MEMIGYNMIHANVGVCGIYFLVIINKSMFSNRNKSEASICCGHIVGKTSAAGKFVSSSNDTNFNY